MTRRRRPNGSSYPFGDPVSPGPAPDVPAPESPAPPPPEPEDFEPIAFVDAEQLPADPEEIGPVIDPSLLDDDLHAPAEIPEPEANDLQHLLDQLASDEPIAVESVPESGPAFEEPPSFHNSGPEAPDRFDEIVETTMENIDDDSSPAVPDANLERQGQGITAAAMRARFVGSNVLPISIEQTVDERSDIDSITYALSAFSEIQYGQLGILRVSARSRPDFKNESRAWLAATKIGENPDERKTFLSKVGAWISYFGAKTVYDIKTINKPKAGEPPTRPGKRGQGVKQIPASQAAPEEKAAWKEAEAKSRDQAHFEVMIRAAVVGGPDDQADCDQIAETAISGLEMFDSEFGIQKMAWEKADPYVALLGLMPAREPKEAPIVLSASEMAAIAHIPGDACRPDGLRAERSRFKTMPISTPLVVDDPVQPPPGIIPLGIQNPSSEDARIVGMRNSDLDRHMLLVGKTGSGKSEMMKWLLFGVAHDDYPLVLVDPHGQLSDEILKALIVNCPERLDDIVYCDLSDPDFPVAFNPIDIDRPELVEPTVSSVSQMLAVQLKLDASSAPRATVFAKAALTALCEANLVLEDPDTKCTLLDVVPFFTDQEFRQLVVYHARNLAVIQNFDRTHGPFEQMSEKQQTEMSMPINRAFSTLAASESFAAVFSAGRNKLNLGGLVGQKKIVLIKLARFSHQAQLGEFVGALIIPWLLSSMDSWGRHRDEITGQEIGQGCRIFVDEAPRVVSGDSSVPELLAEARKWDLGLVMAAQFIEQFPKQIVEAALNNTGSKIGLNCEPKAASELARAVSGASKAVTEMDMATMPNFHFYGNVMLPDPGGVLSPSGPFSAKCLPMINDDLGDRGIDLRQYVIDNSRSTICNSIDEIRKQQKSRLENVKIALANKMTDTVQPDLDTETVLPGDPDPGGFDWTSG